MIRSTLTIAAVVLLGACASPQPSAPAEPEMTAPANAGFTDTELAGMRTCASTASEAFLLAGFKLQGVPLQEMRERNGGRSSEVRSVLESVYRDSFGSPWAYSKEYFRTCAQRSAGIASMERLNLPTLCIWNRNIALVAKARADEGHPVEAVLRQLNFNSAEADEIVRSAYRSRLPAYGFAAETWNQCLGVSPGG